MNLKDKELLTKQVEKLEEVLSVLRTSFEDTFEDEIGFLEIVKTNIAKSVED